MSADAKSQNGDSNRRHRTRRHWIEKSLLVFALIGIVTTVAIAIAGRSTAFARGFRLLGGYVRIEMVRPTGYDGPEQEFKGFGTPGMPLWMRDLWMQDSTHKPLRWLTTIEIRDGKATLSFGNLGSGFEWIPQYRFRRFGIYASSERLGKFCYGFLSLPVLAPMYFFAGFVGIIALRIFRRRMGIRRMKARNECLSCGYSLRGSPSGVCPECGERGDMPRYDPVTQTASKSSI
jgi:hypothetical protein